MDYEIDLWTDGVRLTIEKMCANAGSDITGLMAYDAPASGYIGKASEANSDLHVEWADDEGWDDDFQMSYNEEDALLSMDDALAPANAASEPVPAATHSAFERFGEDVEIPGMFGAALKAYGNAVAIFEQQGVDYTPYKQYFMSEWDLGPEDEELLKSVIPVMRSEGAAMWGGVKRKMVPYCAALPATGSKLRVVQHGKTRRDFGPDVLIDWNRVAEIARATVLQVVADDVYGKHKLKRLDFAIDARSVALAPRGVVLPAFDVPDRAAHHLRPDTRVIKNFLAQCRDAFTQDREKIVCDAIVVEGELSFSGLDVIRAVRKMNPSGVAVKEQSYEEDIDFGLTKVVRIEKRGDIATVEDVLVQFARAAIEAGKFKAYREWQIYQAIESIDEVDEKNYLRKVVKAAYPNNFVYSAVNIWKVFKRSSGGNFVGLLCNYLNAPIGMMQEHHYIRWWINVREIDECLIILADLIVRELSKYYKFGPTKNKIVAKLADSYNPAVPLNTIFHSRKMYWHDRYLANSRVKVEGRVIYQILASVFKMLTVRIDDRGGVTANKDRISGVLCHSAFRFAKKRIGNQVCVMPAMNVTAVQMGRLDTWVVSVCKIGPDPQYSVVMDVCLEKVALFVEDVRKFINHVMLGMANDPEVPENVMSVPKRTFQNVEIDRGAENVVYHAKEPHAPVVERVVLKRKRKKKKKRLPKPVAKPAEVDDWVSEEEIAAEPEPEPDPKPVAVAGGFFDSDDEEDVKVPAKANIGTFDFDDSDDEVVPTRVTIYDLISELKEDYRDMPMETVDEYVGKYGLNVTKEQYEEIKENEKAKHVAKMRMWAKGFVLNIAPETDNFDDIEE